MKVKDLFETEEVDENWKNWVAAGALGAASLSTPANMPRDNYHNMQQPFAQQQSQANDQAELKKTITSNPRELLLKRTAKKAGLSGNELAAFLSQSAHESGEFKTMIEIGNRKYFNQYDIRYNPKKAKELGNIYPGDGYKFRGRGFLQISGRANYTEAGEDLHIPLDTHPELLEQPEIAAKVAIWYWNKRVHSDVKNFKDTRSVTKQINPGLKDLNKRKSQFDKYSANTDQYSET